MTTLVWARIVVAIILAAVIGGAAIGTFVGRRENPAAAGILGGTLGLAAVAVAIGIIAGVVFVFGGFV